MKIKCTVQWQKFKSAAQKLGKKICPIHKKRAYCKLQNIYKVKKIESNKNITIINALIFRICDHTRSDKNTICFTFSIAIDIFTYVFSVLAQSSYQYYHTEQQVVKNKIVFFCFKSTLICIWMKYNTNICSAQVHLKVGWLLYKVPGTILFYRINCLYR